VSACANVTGNSVGEQCAPARANEEVAVASMLEVIVVSEVHGSVWYWAW
jgi:hypothetical protein